MKNLILVVFLFGVSLLNPVPTKAVTPLTLPCSTVLSAVIPNDINAKGVALVYKVKLTESFPRTNISILAVHLPTPSSLGDYDRYEGFAFIPNEISWRFKLYPTQEESGPTWAGRIDDITASLEKATLQVRLSNSRTEKLGPIILSNSLSSCK